MKSYPLEKIISEGQKREISNIVLLTNTISQTQRQNNIEHADIIEYFSDDEYASIYNSICSLGFNVSPYFSEINFIEDVILKRNFIKDILVYNLFRDGRNTGKKSLIPAFCDLMKVRYTGSNAYAISLCRDKYRVNKLLEMNGIVVPKSWLYLGFGEWLGGSKPSIDGHVILKSPYGASSIGISEDSIILNKPNIEEILDSKIIDGCREILVQEYIEGDEIEISFFCGKNWSFILDPVGIDLKDKNTEKKNRAITYELVKNYDFGLFDAKEIMTYKQKKIACEIVNMTIQIIGLRCYGRFDFRINSKGFIHLFDMSSTPYTIPYSSFAFAFEKLGFPYSSIYSAIIGSRMLPDYI